MKVQRLLLPATLVFGLAAYSQSISREANQGKMLQSPPSDYGLAALPLFMFTDKKNNNFPENKISIDRNNVTLQMIFREVRKTTGREYYASQNVLSLSKRIDIHLTNVSLETFLAFIMSRFPVQCTPVGKIIIIKLNTFIYDRISCQVFDSLNIPVHGGFILVKGNHEPHFYDKNGVTHIENVTGLDTLVVYAEGLNSIEVPIESENMTIILKGKAGTLPTYKLTLKNGIRETPADMVTGSAVIPNMDYYYNRNPNPNIVRRLQAISVLAPTSEGNITGITPGSLRGLNSFTGNRNALTVVNGHVLLVNTDNINPNDVDTIYLNRDADAASPWGTSASNGVVYFDLKKGITSGQRLSFFSSFTYITPPNLHYQKGLTATNFIDLQKRAFKANEPQAWSPVYDVLNNKPDSSESILGKWSNNDLKRDLQKAGYQYGVLQQYSLSIQTGTPKIQVYLSAGIDRYKPVEKVNSWNRETSLLNATFQNGAWQAQATVSLAHIKYRKNLIKLPNTLPYINLWDENGDPAPLPAPRTTTDSNFLNSDFVYQNEAALANHVTTQLYQSYLVKLSYQTQFNLKASVNYQFSHTTYDDYEQHELASYYTRTITNLYRQNNNGVISWPITPGDIDDRVTMAAGIHSLRGQLDYLKKFSNFGISGLLGIERRSYDLLGHASRNYVANLSSYSSPIDYSTLFDLTNGKKARIPYINNPLDSADHLFGYYGSGTLSYQERYSLSVNARTDRMNRFSRDQNRKGIGMWSIGTSWHISNESFYNAKNIFSDLKLRVTCGQNGNVDYSIPPFNSIQSAINQGTVYSYAVASTQQIGWEKLFMINAGIDFKTHFVSGSVDLYRKKGWDLLQYTAWNPTVGTSIAKSNSGSLKGGGLDLNLQSNQLTLSGKLKFSLALLLAHTTNKVTSDDGIIRPAQDYTNPGTYIPRKGFPAEAIYAYRYGGLNENGAPKGFLNGQSSEEYSKITGATDGSTIDYIGSATPTTVANMTQSLHYRSFTLSWLIILKTGYYVWTPALNYFKLLQQAGGDAPGYESRYQNTGDKGHTDVPALQFPINYTAMQFYEGSNVHVVKGDHMKLQDIQVCYQHNIKKHPKFPFKSFEASLTAANLGIIWRANTKGIDPDIPIGNLPQPRSMNLTLKLTY